LAKKVVNYVAELLLGHK